MKDLIVSMSVSAVNGMMTDYVRRLSSEGIEVNIDPIAGQSFGLGAKLVSIRNLARRFAAYEMVILSDGWDVMFYGTKSDVMVAPRSRDRVLWASEKNCWPHPELAQYIPGRGPWRFVNGGLLAGSPKAFLDMCDRIEAHPGYNAAYIDQGFMNFLLTQDNADFFDIDWKTNLFFCLHLGHDELEFRGGIPFNTVHKTYPSFVHANGHWPTDDLHRKYQESLQ